MDECPRRTCQKHGSCMYSLCIKPTTDRQAAEAFYPPPLWREAAIADAEEAFAQHAQPLRDEIARLNVEVERWLKAYKIAHDQAMRNGSTKANLQPKLDATVKALDRQCDNMAFILNRLGLPEQWHERFTRELAQDRAALNLMRKDAS